MVKKNNMEAKLIKNHNKWWSLWDMENNCIANTINTDGFPFKLSLKNCQAIENGYDLDDIVKNHPLEGSNYSHSCGLNQGIEYGFQKALEILGDKKFSEEDMIKAMKEYALTWKNENEIIQSLQQTEWKVEIITEPMNLDEIREQGKGFLNSNTNKPKVDEKGKLILKRK